MDNNQASTNISTIKGGIPINRIKNIEKVEVIKDLIKCFICNEILDNPFECSVCDSRFCEDCIHDWIKLNHSCPLKCPNYKVVKAKVQTRKMLGLIILKCKFSPSCSFESEYWAMMDHEATCEIQMNQKKIGSPKKTILHKENEEELMERQRYMTLLEVDPNNKSFHYQLGNINVKLFKLKDALNCYNKVLSLDKNSKEAYKGIGNVYLQQKNNEEALKNFQKALVIDPNYKEVHVALGIAFSNLNLTEEAINSYKKALSCDSSYRDAYYHLGMTYKNMTLYDKALENINKTIELDTNFQEGYMAKGNIFICLEEYEKAISMFLIASKINPKNIDAYINIGVAYDKQGKFKESIDFNRKVLELDTKNNKALLNIGISLDNWGKHKKAIEVYKTILELYPNNIDALLNIGVSLDKLGRYDESAQMYNKIIVDVDPYCKLAYNNLGNCLMHNRKFEESIIKLKKALEIDPNYITAKSNLEKAIKSYEVYLKYS